VHFHTEGQKSGVTRLSPNSTFSSRHDTTRYLAHTFWHRKRSWRAFTLVGQHVTWHACRAQKSGIWALLLFRCMHLPLWLISQDWNEELNLYRGFRQASAGRKTATLLLVPTVLTVHCVNVYTFYVVSFHIEVICSIHVLLV